MHYTDNLNKMNNIHNIDVYQNQMILLNDSMSFY